MEWLTAALAFCVTMLVFSIVVSTIVEMIHRLLRLREGGMRVLLENVYDKAVKPRLGTDLAASRDDFVDAIMSNRAVFEEGKRVGRTRKGLRWLLGSSTVTRVPVELFTQKLADSRIVNATAQIADETIADIAQKYEAFGQEASFYFQKRARMFSVIVSFFLAWLLFIHPYEIAKAYIENPDVARSVADQSERAYADFERLQGEIERLRADTDASADGFRTAAEELLAQFDKARADANSFAARSVPVGWPPITGVAAPCRFFGVELGNTDGTDNTDGKRAEPMAGFCGVGLFGSEFRAPSIWNAFWLLAGGLLVGLGAPFWAQAVSSVTAARNASGKISEIADPYIAGNRVTLVAPAAVVPPAAAAGGVRTASSAPLPSGSAASGAPAPKVTGASVASTTFSLARGP